MSLTDQILHYLWYYQNLPFCGPGELTVAELAEDLGCALGPVSDRCSHLTAQGLLLPRRYRLRPSAPLLNELDPSLEADVLRILRRAGDAGLTREDLVRQVAAARGLGTRETPSGALQRSLREMDGWGQIASPARLFLSPGGEAWCQQTYGNVPPEAA